MRLSQGLVVLLVFGACSGFVPTQSPENASQHPAMNRWVKPLQFQGARRLDKDDVLKASKHVNSIYYFLLGTLQAQNQNTQAAIVALERVRGLDPESPALHLSLAQEYLKASRPKEGVALVRRALELQPQFRDAKFLLANLYANAKQYSEAFQLFQELSVENPDDEDVVLYLALMDIEQKDLDSAQTRLQKFLQRNPESASAHFYAGRLYQERGLTDKALQSYETAIDLRPGFVQAGTYLGYLQEELGLKAAASQTYAWLAAQTDEATYHRKLGQLYWDMSQYSQALKSFQNLHRLDPSDLNNQIKIGLVWVELKEPDQARVAFEKVLDASPGSDNVRFYLANLLESENKTKEALRHYEKLKEGSQLFIEALKRRVVLMAQLGRIKEAERILQGYRNSDSNPLGAEDYFELLVTLFDQSGRQQQALSAVEEGLDVTQVSERLLYLKGTLLEKDARFEEATEVMKLLLKKNPQHAGALNFVGYLWADQGVRLIEAEGMIRQALQLRPDDPYILDSLGWVQYRLGRYQEAHATLARALSFKPHEAIILDHWGDVLVKLGRIDEAFAAYEKVQRLGLEREHERHRFEQKWASFTKQVAGDCAAGRLRLPLCDHGVFQPRTPASTPGPRDLRKPF